MHVCASTVNVIRMCAYFFRKEALLIWKQRLGSSATYNKLISVFERAGYKTYADKIREIVHVHGGETDSSGSSEQSSQPQTYPHLKPLNPPLPTESLLSETEPYLLIDPAVAKSLPQGENLVTIKF